MPAIRRGPLWLALAVAAAAGGYLLLTSGRSGAPARDSEPPASVGSNAELVCPALREPVRIGSLPPELPEISGLAASRSQPGVFYAHNDSGGRERVFTITAEGRLVATFELADAPAEDWEDVAVGPGPDARASYVFVGDFGDNFSTRRTGVLVHRFMEPRLEGAVADRVVSLTYATFRFRYPRGPRDAEALFVDPKSGDLYVISKGREGAPEVYVSAAPHREEGASELELAATLESSKEPTRWVTAADISADGAWILVRTYTEALLYRRTPNETIAEAFAKKPCRVGVAKEEQGESIGFSADGRAYFTASEGEAAAIYRVPFDPATFERPSE